MRDIPAIDTAQTIEVNAVARMMRTERDTLVLVDSALAPRYSSPRIFRSNLTIVEKELARLVPASNEPQDDDDTN